MSPIELLWTAKNDKYQLCRQVFLFVLFISLGVCNILIELILRRFSHETQNRKEPRAVYIGHNPSGIIHQPAQDLPGWLPYQQNRRSQSVNNPSQASADAQELSV